MQQTDIRYLFDFDRWATRRVLSVIDGLPEAVWGADRRDRRPRPRARSSSTISVRTSAGGTGCRAATSHPRPEREPLPSPAGLAEAWAHEWDDLDALAGHDHRCLAPRARRGRARSGRCSPTS